MCDIALGLKAAGLEAFAAARNASYMSQWRDLGLYDEDEVQGWGEAFQQVVEKTLAAGGRIHFNLTGINVNEALSGDPEEFVGRYTAWELQQVVRNELLFSRTQFYLDGDCLGLDRLATLGIKPPQRDIM